MVSARSIFLSQLTFSTVDDKIPEIICKLRISAEISKGVF
jgi:hypothetical protein